MEPSPSIRRANDIVRFGIADSSLLASLYDNESPARNRADPIAALDEARSGEARLIASVAAEPQVKRDMALFMQALASAVTPVGRARSPVPRAQGVADRE